MLLNTALMRNPMNWVVVTLMATLGLMLATTIAQGVAGRL